MKNHPEHLCTDCSSIEELKKQHHYFVSHMSHEIRNPLTLVSSSLQLLEMECPSVKNSFLWSQIREDIQNTICLLQEISSFNNSGKQNLSEFSLKQFLSSLSMSISSYMEQKNISFSLLTEPSADDLILTADRRKLQEALTNLLINASDALLESKTVLHSHPQIILTAECFDKILHIHVKDNGPGIPDSYLPTLFDPFVTHKSSGTGLGLAIVKNVVELHGGTISVQTSQIPGESYTDFYIQIPVS